MRHLTSILLLGCWSALLAQPTVSWSGENMSLASASVTPAGSAWSLALVMADDNGNSALPSSYRRWWHCEIGGLNPNQPDVLLVQVSNVGYGDVILPTWSLSSDYGQSWTTYQRVPTAATPTYGGGSHSFTLTVPAGITDLRLAKYFPYSVSAKDAWLGTIASHPHVESVTVIGSSVQGRPLELIKVTDSSAPAVGKRRVWIHAGIHPAETTSYFVVEGLVAFLLSGDARAEALLDAVIFDIVPMANPDGVFLGNYRTNASSANLETAWTAPYQSSQPEVQALIAQIEVFMGTAAAPGAHPIELLLNLHSSHGLTWPFHYQHAANANWDPVSDRYGVLPAVNALEGAWISSFEGRSPFVNQGSTATSSCGAPTRPYVECMMHDRWSADPAWTGPPNNRAPVTAITFEGTYGPGPSAAWNTSDDYRQVGADMALAVADFLGVLPFAALTPIGSACPSGPSLTANLIPLGASGYGLNLLVTGSPVTANAWLVVGLAEQQIPLPPSGCNLLVTPDLLIPVLVNGTGTGSLLFQIPVGSALAVKLQYVAAPVVGSTYQFFPSAGYALDLLY